MPYRLRKLSGYISEKWQQLISQLSVITCKENFFCCIVRSTLDKTFQLGHSSGKAIGEDCCLQLYICNIFPLQNVNVCWNGNSPVHYLCLSINVTCRNICKMVKDLSDTGQNLLFINGSTCCVIQLLGVTWHVSAFCEGCCVVLKIQAFNFGPGQEIYFSLQTWSGSFRCILCSASLGLLLCECRDQLMPIELTSPAEPTQLWTNDLSSFFR